MFNQPMTEHKEDVERLVLSPLEVAADGREAARRERFPGASVDNRFDPCLGGSP